MNLFCPTCHRYHPAPTPCLCGRTPAPWQTPTAPARPLWQAALPGAAAAEMALAAVAGVPALLAAWGGPAAAPAAQPPAGGVSALGQAEGALLWSQPLPWPVEGGVLAAGDGVVVGGGQGASAGGVIALDLASGRERWRRPLPGPVRSAPTAYEDLLCTIAGCELHGLSLESGEPLLPPLRLINSPRTSPAAPVLVCGRGGLIGVITATYGADHGRIPGVIAFHELHGRSWRQRWQQPALGWVRATPVVQDQRVFVASFGYRDRSGSLLAYDLRSGEPAWARPFELRPQGPEASCHLSASPLVHEGVVYAGSLDHHLYALDAASGRLLWRWAGGGGIATRPLWVEGLILLGAHNGQVYALDAASRELAWSFPGRGHMLSHPLAVNGAIAVASEEGQVALLPWHLGRYDWAAGRLQAAQRFDEAGDALALAAEFDDDPERRDQRFAAACADWQQGGHPEKVGWLLAAQGRDAAAAAAFMTAARHWRTRQPATAAAAYAAAANLYFCQHAADRLGEAAQGLAACAGLPFLHLEARNSGPYEQGVEGQLTLRVENRGQTPAPDGVSFWLGGGLQRHEASHLAGVLAPGQMRNIPLTIIPVAAQSTLVVEYRYATGRSDYPSLRGWLDIPLEARPPRQQPLQIGDVHTLQVVIAGHTEEGVAIETRDVGVLRAEAAVGGVQIAGDAGAVIARRGEIGSVQVGGEVGAVRGQGGAVR